MRQEQTPVNAAKFTYRACREPTAIALTGRTQERDGSPSTCTVHDEVQAEDAGICTIVQRNLHSRAYRSGPYSPKRENGVHHFHRLMSRRLAVR